MKTKLLTMCAVAVVMMVLCAPALADWQRSPASDVDKEGTANGEGNPGLAAGVPPVDNSCWIATASNLLAGAGYGTGATLQERADDIYLDMLIWQRSQDPAGDPHGTRDGGWMDNALTWWLGSANNTWPANPYNVVTVYGNKTKVPWANANGARYIGNQLREYQQVGLSISFPRTTAGGSPDGGHAITCWGDDGTSATLATNPGEVIVADSDRDNGGDFQTYTYDNYTNPNPGGFNEGNGWYFNFSANHWFIKHIATLCPTDSPVDPADGPTQKCVGSYKIHQDDLESATDLHYTAYTDYDILGYRTEIDWTTANDPPDITESNTHFPSLTRSDIDVDWDLSDNPVPYCTDVTITTEFILQGWNGVWYDDVYFTYPDAEETKFLQGPDADTGTDIRVDDKDGVNRLLADDFECVRTGPVTKIYLWGSWRHDYPIGTVDKFNLYIYSDDPVGDGGNPNEDPDNQYSMPLEMLWSGTFDDFESSVYKDGVEEYFWCPYGGYITYDNTVYQYIIDIPESSAFDQQGSQSNPKIYWLGVSAEISGENDPQFGWKTTYPRGEMNDRAVMLKASSGLTDEFDYGEDTTTHSYTTTGYCDTGAYSCDTNSLRIGNCSSDTGSAQITVDVMSGCDQVKLRYKVRWGANATLTVDGVDKGTISGSTCNWQEKLLTNMSAHTGDGQLDIKIADEIPNDCDGDIQITYLEVYSIQYSDLTYPSAGGHPYPGQDVDMAFGIVTTATDAGTYLPEFGWNIVTPELVDSNIDDITGGYVIGAFDLFSIDPEPILLGQYRFVHQYPYTQDPEQHTFTVAGLGSSSGPCANFDDVTRATYYYGDTFTTQGHTVEFKEFYWLPSGSTTSGYGQVQPAAMSGGSGDELELNNINAEFTFGYPVECITFLFGEYGGNINLEVNGDFRNFQNFAGINGSTIGGCAVTVTNGYGNDTGTVTIQGTIQQFKVGGQELFIDDVCPFCDQQGGNNYTATNFRFGHLYGMPDTDELWQFSDWMTGFADGVDLSSGSPTVMAIDWDGRLPYPASNITPLDEMPDPPDCTVYHDSDLNKDCCVNMLDFAIMADEWLQCTSD